MPNKSILEKVVQGLFVAGAVCSLAVVTMNAQTGRITALASSCTKDNAGVYRCGLEPFQSRLAGARTVAIEAGPLDRYTARELRHLAERLGKEIVQPGQTADLTFSVVPVTESAVAMGPADRPLASLLVYARNGQEGHGTLVWSETFTGQDDRPWPMVVRAVIDQFQGRVEVSNRLAKR